MLYRPPQPHLPNPGPHPAPADHPPEQPLPKGQVHAILQMPSPCRRSSQCSHGKRLLMLAQLQQLLGLPHKADRAQLQGGRGVGTWGAGVSAASELAFHRLAARPGGTHGSRGRGMGPGPARQTHQQPGVAFSAWRGGSLLGPRQGVAAQRWLPAHLHNHAGLPAGSKH